MWGPKQPRVGIIGVGNIGSELYRRVVGLGWKVGFVVKSDGVYRNLTEKIDRLDTYLDYSRKVDLVFLAIPTLDDGTAAYEYITSLLAINIPVVTCEKGALSSHFTELEPQLYRLGYNASVGGGTRFLHYMEGHVGPWTQEIHAVLNCTLNFLLTEVERGRPFTAAAAEAKNRGYAEPGITDPYEIFNQEAKEDVVMKTAILFNLSGFTQERIRTRDLEVKEMRESEVLQVIREAAHRRYIVSITRGTPQRQDRLGGFRLQVGEWMVLGGFQAIDANPLFPLLLFPGITNGIVISEGGTGVYRATGHGGGPGPTTSAMIKDALQLLNPTPPAVPHGKRR